MIPVLVHRLRQQDGVAMVVVMGALLIVSLSAAALASGANQTNNTAITDSNSKRALGAAEAGLQVATQRYDAFRTTIQPTECLGDPSGPVAVGRIPMGTGATAATTECDPVIGGADVGDDATYSYVISLPGAPCRAAPTATTAVTANDRCVTSTGTVNGITRRVQTRLGLAQGPPFFEHAGLVGLDSLSFTNSNTINAGVGSNGQVTVGNSVTVNGDAVLGPDAPGYPNPNPALGNSADHNGNVIRRTAPYTLELGPVFETVETANNNSTLPPALLDSGRHFRINGGTYTFPDPGPSVTGPIVYHFCSIYLDNSVDLRIPAGREVKIYVDSPTRPSPWCSSGGTVTFNNSICVNVPNCDTNSPGLASKLEFYLAGTGGQDLYLNNSLKLSALFYAPNTVVNINNSIWLNGALAAKVVNVNNSITFTWPADAREDSGPNRRAAWSGWFECSPRRTVATDPESGC